MGDLISRSALIKILKEWADTNAMRGYDTAYDVVQDCISTVENQPTAYDVEKVVAELEAKENEWWDTYSLSSGFDEYAHGKNVGFEEAIDIVKRGGVE